jgi:DNA-binding FadR family transcriptional regulator
MEISEGALVQLRAYIAQGQFDTNDRLPSERVLCDELGVPRSELRKAFAVLETEGSVWRHVGRGTFVGHGSTANKDGSSIASIAKRTTPREVMYARLVFEPMLAKEAAMHATAEHVEELTKISRNSQTAKTWREYEALDNHFHSLIAASTQNTPLIAMFDQLNALRRTVVWGRLRIRPDHPPADHHSFVEHQAILDTIEDRDAENAFNSMRNHLQSVTRQLFSMD